MKTKLRRLSLWLSIVAWMAVAMVTLGATFTALCGTGAACAYQVGDKFGYQTVELIRTNFNDLQTRLQAVEAAYVTASSSTAFTNKTYDAEGTGNVLTVPLTLEVTVAVCDGSGWSNLDFDSGTHDGAHGVPSYECYGGLANGARGHLKFFDTETESAYGHFLVPAGWTGAIDLKLKWLTSATTGNVVWQIKTKCVADNEATDAAWNTAQTITDATKGTAYRVNDASLSSVTTTGCAAGEDFRYAIVRNPAHASDTIAADAYLQSLEFTLRRAM